MSCRAVALLLLIVAACGGAQTRAAQRSGEEYLAEIRIEGNAHVPADDLVPGLMLRRVAEAGRPVDPFVLANDVTRIRGAYVRLGYFAVDVRTRLDHAGLATTVVFVVREGVRAKTRVELIGLPTDDPLVSASALRKLVPLADGAPFDYDVYDDAKKTLLAAISDAGYAHAQLSATVIANRVSGEALARYIFDAGPTCVFGAVTIQGAPGDLEDAVSARLAFRPGDKYSASALAKTQRALYDLQRFSTVRVDPDKDPAATTIAIKISVAVGTRHETKFGGGLGYEPLTVDASARAAYSVAGCLDALTTCLTDFQPAVTLDHNLQNPEPKIRAVAGLSRLDFLRPFVKADAEIGWDYLTVEAYTYTGPHARLALSTPLGVPWLQLRVGWLLEVYGFINIDTVVDDGARSALGLEGLSRVGEYQEALQIDLRDNPLEPHRGFYFNARFGEGTRAAGGEYRYLEVEPELRGYLPLAHWVLAARAHAGDIIGQVAPTERYFSGGATTQRGFNERRLAPTISGYVDGDFHSVPVGGAVLVETGVELRTPPAELFGVDLAAVVFLDGGDVTDTRAEMDLDHLHWATGAGLRIPTSFGAIRLDVGYRLNRTGPAEPEPTGTLRPFAIHIGIGEAY